MERCEKGKPDQLVDRVRSMRAKSGGYADRLLTAEKSFCVPLSSTTATPTVPADPKADLKSQLTQAQLEKYSRAYDDSPHVSAGIILYDTIDF